MTRILWGSLTVLCASASWLAAQSPAPLNQAVTLGRPIAADAPAPVPFSSGLVPVAAFDAGTPIATTPTAPPPPPVFRGQMDAGPGLPPPPPPPPPPAVALPGPPPPGGDNCQPRIWGSLEYLLWWVKDGPLPVVQLENGLDYGAFSGGRLTIGGWFNANRTFGIEGSGFLLQQRSDDLFATAFTPAVPGTGFGPSFSRALVDSQSQLWGLEVNGIFNISRTEKFHVDWLAGVRYLNLSEDMNANAAARTVVGGIPFGAASNLGVDTRNQFFGGQVGVKTGVRFGKFYTDFIGKLGLGNMHETVDFAGTARVRAGGLAIAGPVLGRQSRNEFCVIPELQVQVGYDFNRYVRAFVGYDLLYVSNVVRPGDQFEFVNQRGTDFWAQGVSFGLEIRY